MLFLNDISNFSSSISTNKKPRKKKYFFKTLKRNTFNPDVGNAAAVGGGIGLSVSAIGGGSTRLNKIGAATGLAAGTGLGIAYKYRKNNNK
jgi:hypothetical protein